MTKSDCDDECQNNKNTTLLVGCLIVGAGLYYFYTQHKETAPNSVLTRYFNGTEEEKEVEKVIEAKEVKDLIQKLEHKMEEPKKSKEEELLEDFKKLNLDDLTEEEVLHWHKVLSNLN